MNITFLRNIRLIGFTALLISGYCLLLPYRLFAQPFAEAKDTVEIAVVVSRNISPYLSALDGFKEKMGDQGYRLNIAYYDLGGDMDAASSIVSQILKLDPSLVLTIGSEATKAIGTQINTIPIVFSMSLDPFFGSRKRTNITGSSMNVPIRTQVKELVNIIPRMEKIGIVCSDVYYNRHLSGVQMAISLEFNVEFLTRFAENEADFTEAVKQILPEIDVFLFVPDETLLSPRTMQFLLLESFRYNKPVVGPSLRFVQEGALFALGSDYKDIGRQSAELAIDILQGKNAFQLPVTEARKAKLYLNRRTAKQIGIPIPQSVVSRVEKIFE
ncbi:MAG: hypothetical protein DRP74_05265 [Candidatus Omnitrophota bacterium]|nr:MAG: hypothetical protein DRP74_05265 [Candidatus Omnitrophota bacterium]